MVDRQVDRELDGLVEFAMHLPGNRKHSLEIVVLRGHLLIERQVLRLVNERFQRPNAFELSRMPSAALLRLAEALYGSEFPDWVWSDAKELNTIRNSIAHELVDDTLGPRIARFISRFAERERRFPAQVDKPLPGQLAYCLELLHEEFLKVGKEG
jgi:hypothetical protein